MIDPTDFEKACMEKALRPLGEIVAEIGPHKAFADLSREQVIPSLRWWLRPIWTSSPRARRRSCSDAGFQL